MASEPPRRVLDPLTAPQHYMPPGARELRAQAVQRLQAGLFGLAAIVLIVGLASIINERARQADAATQPQAAGGVSPAAQGDSDPLAEVGVVPSTSPDQASPSPLPPAAAVQPARPAPAGQTN
jgi:hypothetical protein